MLKLDENIPKITKSSKPVIVDIVTPVLLKYLCTGSTPSKIQTNMAAPPTYLFKREEELFLFIL